MKELFEEIVRDGEAALQRLLEEHAQEDVDLEFKAKDTNRVQLTDGDKKTIGKTLSAFANSAGGLLVFGADARPDNNRVDRLSELKPIPEIDRTLSEVRSLVGHILLPRHDGIRVERIRSARDPATGYLAIYTERSERRPHMSKAPDDGRYYKRGGTSTFSMEHFDIEDAFKRLTVPALSTALEVGRARMNRMADGWIVPIALALENTGDAIARFPYISILKTNAYLIDDHHHDFRPRWRLTRDTPGYQLTGGTDDVIHVGTTQIGGYLYVPVTMRDGRFTIFGDYYEEASVSVALQFGAEGFRGAVAEFEFNGGDMHQAMRRGGAVA